MPQLRGWCGVALQYNYQNRFNLSMMQASSTTILARSHVTVSGTGEQTIVFLHGLGADQTQWHQLVPAFEEHYRVVLLDLVGSGQSDTAAYSSARHGSLAGHAEDLLNVLAALDCTGAHFVGHSVGAIIGVLAAVRQPERFAQLALIAPSPRFLNDTGYAGGFEQNDLDELLWAMEENYHGWSADIAPVMIGNKNHALILALTNSFINTNPDIARHFARVTFLSDTRPELSYLTTPALILQSRHDVVAPLAVGQYLHHHLPDSQLVVLDTQGHCPQLTAPQQTLAALQGFLGRPTPAAGPTGPGRANTFAAAA